MVAIPELWRHQHGQMTVSSFLVTLIGHAYFVSVFLPTVLFNSCPPPTPKSLSQGQAPTGSDQHVPPHVALSRGVRPVWAAVTTQTRASEALALLPTRATFSVLMEPVPHVQHPGHLLRQAPFSHDHRLDRELILLAPLLILGPSDEDFSFSL